MCNVCQRMYQIHVLVPDSESLWLSNLLYPPFENVIANVFYHSCKWKNKVEGPYNATLIFAWKTLLRSESLKLTDSFTSLSPTGEVATSQGLWPLLKMQVPYCSACTTVAGRYRKWEFKSCLITLHWRVAKRGSCNTFTLSCNVSKGNNYRCRGVIMTLPW